MVKPLIKYQGGKTKELPIIKPYIPSTTKRIVEPFCGGAAVAFHYELPAILNDVNRDVINLYSVVADDDLYPELQKKINFIKTLEHDDLQKEYYVARNVINQSWENVNHFERALSFVIVRQLCFSGMERYNSNGEFNVPFGHYKRFACNLSPDHHRFLKKCIIRHGSAIDVFDMLKDDDFVFVDPPYLDRLGYTTGDGGIQLHQQLANNLNSCNLPWLLIHCDDEFYRDEYTNQYLTTGSFNYAQRFGKNKNHTGSKVEHLYISNIM